MIEKIKKDLADMKYKKINIKVNNIRNKSEMLKGKIMEIYPRVFVVETTDGLNRSFSYADVLIGNIEIGWKMLTFSMEKDKIVIEGVDLLENYICIGT